MLHMKVTYEVLRYDEADSQGDVFPSGCFADAEGKEVPVSVNFDLDQTLGFGTLHSTDEALLVEIDSELVERLPSSSMVAAYGGTKVTPAEVGFVLPEQKVK